MVDIARRAPSCFSPRNTLVVLCAGFALLGAAPCLAGGTPATGADSDQLQTMGGGGAEPGVGDAISSYLTTTGANMTVGLDEPYDYYIEVPDSQTRLVVEIFDADVYSAGVADDNGERDQNRNSAYNTKARYRLFDPAGNLVATRFAYGDDATSGGSALNPPGSDDAWLTMYDNDTAGITGGDTFADDFSTAASYANNSGSVNFAGSWVEANDLGAAGGAGAGDVQVTGGELVIHNRSDTSPFSNQPTVSRQVGDMTSYAAAVVSFDYTSGAGVERIEAAGGDSIAFEVSDDGGTTWSILDEFAGLGNSESGSVLYDITDFLAADTRLRFRITNRYAGTFEEFRVDDFQVRAVTTANGPDPDNGHWRLTVDMTGDVNGQIVGGTRTSQNDVNAFGLRAHDGTSGSGGQEYNVYAESFVIVGINNNDRGRDYDFYPYVTEGCTARVRDFDFDADQSNPPAPNTNTQPFGSLDLTSRSTSFTHSNSDMSDNDAWNTETVATWSTDDQADDYGIWLMEVRIEDWNDNNYGPIYMGNEDSAAPPPTANPETDTFRLYFPTDGDGAPSKPYLSQFLAYVPDLSGSTNPPALGLTSRYAVTVQVNNPASSIGDITFSASNLVTANIPGSSAVYGGLAFVTTGTVTAQPTVGGTGNITWNPGTVSPGDTESLVYFVDVTGTGADVVATGTAGSGNGTRATWIDETEDSTNSRATLTFGELCELTVATAPPTQVLITEVGARAVDGATVVEWTTAAETGAMRFDVLRADDRGRLTRAVPDGVPALVGEIAGGTYRAVDDSWRGMPGDRATYWIRETEASGRERFHGPFEVTVEAGGDRPPIRGYDRRAHAKSQRAVDPVPVQRTVKATPTRDVPRRLDELPRLRLDITETGLYRVSAGELADGFGITVAEARRLLSRRMLDLTVDGASVAWRRVGRSLGLEFVGMAIDSPFDRRNVYQLTAARGQIMPALAGGSPPTDWDVDSFRDQMHVEDATIGVVLMPLDPQSDTWYWRAVRSRAGLETASFDIDVPAAKTGSDGDLTVFLQGASQTDHEMVVRWNGSEIGRLDFADFEAGSATFPVPAGAVTAGTHAVEIENVSTSPDESLVFVDAFDLSWDRPYRPTADQLVARGVVDGGESAAPFSPGSGAILVFDLSDPRRPVPLRVRTFDEADGVRAVWRSQGAGPRLVVSEAAIRQPTLTVDLPSDLRAADNRADWLAIAPLELLDAVAPLVSRRQDQGLEALAIDLQDVFDEFSFGRRNPDAIRTFLAHAVATWDQAPRHVLLVGAGSYDYLDHLGLGGNLLPVLQGTTGEILFNTDTLLGDFDLDGVPEVMVGRLPALAASEVDDYVAKVAAYEDAADHPSRVHLVVDEPEPQADFLGDHSTLLQLVPRGFDATSIDLGSVDTSTARQMLFDGLGAGTAWLHYTGHAAPNRLGDSGILTNGDVASLDNAITPVVTSMTCHINHHSLPGFDTLGELLVVEPAAGAVAVFAPVTLSDHVEGRFFGDRVFRRAFPRRGETVDTIGDILLDAFADAIDAGIPPEVLHVYQLLGDPALPMRLEPDPAEQSGTVSGPG